MNYLGFFIFTAPLTHGNHSAMTRTIWAVSILRSPPFPRANGFALAAYRTRGDRLGQGLMPMLVRMGMEPRMTMKR